MLHMVLLQIESGTLYSHQISLKSVNFDLVIVKSERVPFLKHSVSCT